VKIDVAVTVLLVGFGRFPRAAFNPTGPLVRCLASRRRPALLQVTRIAHVLPTSYRCVEDELPDLIARYRPDVIILFGLAQRSTCVRIETRATNRRSQLFPDVEGCVADSPRIRRGAALWMCSKAPHRRLCAAARAAGVSARLSHDAGRYLCNFAYWLALERATEADGPRLVQFIHVPAIDRNRHPHRIGGRRHWTASDLLRAGEQIVLELVACARSSAVNRART